MIGAATASNCFHSCCGMAQCSAAPVIGRWRIGAGSPSFEYPAQQIVFQEAIDAIEDAARRLYRLERQLAQIVPNWSMAPVVEAYQAMRGASSR